MYVAGLCSAAVCALWWGPADVVEVAVSVMWRVVIVCGNRLGDTVFPENSRRAAVVVWMCIGVVWYNREFVGACKWREDDTIVAEWSVSYQEWTGCLLGRLEHAGKMVGESIWVGVLWVWSCVL